VNHRTKIISTSLVLLNSVQVSIWITLAHVLSRVYPQSYFETVKSCQLRIPMHF
jgi:hypothetical protein